MHLKEVIQKDIETINKMDNRHDKLVFIWDYYKIPIISLVVVLFLSVIAISNNLNKKDKLMYVVLLNNDAEVVEVDDQVFVRELEKAGIDIEDKEVDITDYLSLGVGNEDEDGETLQVLNALFTLTDLDLFVAPAEKFELFAEKDGYADLGELIDAALLEQNSDILYKCENSEGETIIAGIILREDSCLHKAGYYHDEVVIGIASNAIFKENALTFIEQILAG